MLAETLIFLSKELNGYFNRRLGPTLENRVLVGNVARAFDASVTGANSVDDRLVISLVNIEEDRVARQNENYRKSDMPVTYRNPPVLLNLYVLFSSAKNTYLDCLTQLGLVIQYFQSQNHFTPETHPDLDARIEKLTVEMYTMNFEQVNHLWSTLGGKYIPSVLYKVKQVAVDDEVVLGEAGLITDISLFGRSKRGAP